MTKREAKCEHARLLSCIRVPKLRVRLHRSRDQKEARSRQWMKRLRYEPDSERRIYEKSFHRFF